MQTTQKALPGTNSRGIQEQQRQGPKTETGLDRDHPEKFSTQRNENSVTREQDKLAQIKGNTETILNTLRPSTQVNSIFLKNRVCLPSFLFCFVFVF